MRGALKRVGSAPVLKGPGSGDEGRSESGASASGSGSPRGATEVYVVSRPFTEWGGRFFNALPPRVRSGVVDLGVCHFMTVFKTPDGRLHQFDFGPRGGDIAIRRRNSAAPPPVASSPSGNWVGSSRGGGAGREPGDASAPGPAARLFQAVRGLVPFRGGAGGGDAAGAARRKRFTAGEVRENALAAMPETSVYVGSTRMSLADVRAFNTRLHRTDYELHHNDCRHYVNSLVAYSTGLENASRHLLRENLRRQRDSLGAGSGVGGLLMDVGQNLTDVANWRKIEAAGRASLAAVATIAGRGVLSVTKVPLTSALVPAAPGVLVRKPVTTAFGVGAATFGFSQVPIVREVMQAGMYVSDTTSRALNIGMGALAALATNVHTASSGAYSSTVGLGSQAAAFSVALAHATTRGFASMMVRQPIQSSAPAEKPAVAVTTARRGPLRITPRLPGLPRVQQRKDGSQIMQLAVVPK